MCSESRARRARFTKQTFAYIEFRQILQQCITEYTVALADLKKLSKTNSTVTKIKDKESNRIHT